MIINLTPICCSHIHFVCGRKKKRSQDILLTIVQHKRVLDWSTLSGPLYNLFFLPLLSKQWSFIHYSAIRDCQDFLAVELGSSYISLKMWKNVFAKLLERETERDTNSYNIINPCEHLPQRPNLSFSLVMEIWFYFICWLSLFILNYLWQVLWRRETIVNRFGPWRKEGI